MAITPNDQTRQFDFDRGVPRSILTSLAAPPATAATAETRANNLVTNGSDGTGAGTNTPRPKAGSAYITAGTNPAPPGNAQRDAIREANEIASVAGTLAPPSGLTAGTPGGTGGTGAGTVTLTWTAVPGATGYKVERRAGTSGAWGAGTPATAPGATSPQTALSTGVNQFRVTATVAGSKDSGPSVPVSATIPA